MGTSRQAAWEVSAVARAVARFRENAERGDVVDMPAGRRVLMETVQPVTDALRKAQDGVGIGAAGRGKPSPWAGPVLTFEADVLAVVAVSTALQSVPLHGGRLGQTTAAFSKRIGRALRDQADHDAFVDRETAERAAAVKAARDQGATPETLQSLREGSLLRLLRRLHPQTDRKDWGRFVKRIELARSEPWSDTLRTHVGGVLLRALADGAPRWFEVAQFGPGPAARAPLCLLLTDHAVEQMADVTVRSEVARPMLLPMLIPPNPWRYAQ